MRILDLQDGRLKRTEGEANVSDLSWSPTANRWAVLAAEPGSGLPEGAGANNVRGGTHIDIGTPDGTVRHLHPPEQLKLVNGPWWSPDGALLAVESEVSPARKGQGDLAAIWLVDASTSGTRMSRQVLWCLAALASSAV